MSTKKLWDKGYAVDKDVKQFIVGNYHELDMRLVKYGRIASMAHARMLGSKSIDQVQIDKIKSSKVFQL